MATTTTNDGLPPYSLRSDTRVARVVRFAHCNPESSACGQHVNMGSEIANFTDAIVFHDGLSVPYLWNSLTRMACQQFDQPASTARGLLQLHLQTSQWITIRTDGENWEAVKLLIRDDGGELHFKVCFTPDGWRERQEAEKKQKKLQKRERQLAWEREREEEERQDEELHRQEEARRIEQAKKGRDCVVM